MVEVGLATLTVESLATDKSKWKRLVMRAKATPVDAT